jgi:hypothetical protein
VEPVWTFVLASSDPDYVPVPHPSLDLRRLLVSSVPGLTWVWFSCIKCKRTRYGIHWWALFDGCDHQGGWHEPTNNNPKGFSNDGLYGTFPQWLESVGLTMESMGAEATENPWA